MALLLSQKLRIKDGMQLLTVNAPADFLGSLGPLPPTVQLLAKAEVYHQIHWFVKDKRQLDAGLGNILGLLKPEVVCWIYYPKSTSKIQTDLTRDHGWDGLLALKQLQWLSLISFDTTWSAFGVRLLNSSDSKKVAKAGGQVVSNFVDAATKTIRLPQYLASALTSNTTAAAFFDQLSFTNKKEYIEWFVTAKREETRQQRVAETIVRLAKGYKNPRNL